MAVPPYLVDGPGTRLEIARFHDEVDGPGNIRNRSRHGRAHRRILGVHEPQDLLTRGGVDGPRVRVTLFRRQAA